MHVEPCRVVTLVRVGGIVSERNDPTLYGRKEGLNRYLPKE